MRKSMGNTSVCSIAVAVNRYGAIVMRDEDRDAYRIPEFCLRNGFSQAMYFKIKAAMAPARCGSESAC